MSWGGGRIPALTAARQCLVSTGLSGRRLGWRKLYHNFWYNTAMKIKEILAAGRPSVSFEVFPPKKDAPFAPVKEAIERLAK